MTERRSHYSLVRVTPVILMTVAVFLLSFAARAATVLGYTDLVTRLEASTPADHEIKFVTASGVDAPSDTMTVTFQANFNLTTVNFNDIDLAVDTDGTPGDCSGTFSDKTLAATPGLSPTWGAAVSGQTLTLTPPTNASAGEIAVGSCVRILIGHNASFGVVDPTTNHRIVNPTVTGSTELTLGGGFGDTGRTFIPITHKDQIRVTATVGTPSGVGGCTATVISNVHVINITETSADVLWDTDISTTSRVDYGPTTSYGSIASSPATDFNHSVHLSGLALGTLYHFRVTSNVGCGASSSSGDMTIPTPDTTAPVLSNAACSSITGTSFTITWDTNEDSDSQVDYGTAHPFSGSVYSAVMTNSHSMNLTGLTPNTTYKYIATSADASGNHASTSELECSTIDTVPPAITNVSCDAITNTSFRVNWTTDKLADSKVDYGLTDSYGQAVSDAGLIANHKLILTPLQSATTYHYKVTSKNSLLNSSSSADFTCKTLTDSTPPSNVTNFTADSCNGNATLNWTNPSDTDFAGVRIQRGTGSNPATPASGTNVYDSNGNTFIDSGLPLGVTQYYTAFSYDTSGNFASGAIQNVTPSSVHSPFCPAPPPVCGDGICQATENATSCPADCTIKPSCYACSRATYDVYIINPDLSERHMGTPWVRVEDLGGGIYRLHFEDATLNPADPNFDYNDAVVDVDTHDCSALKFTFVSSDAGWDHKVRFKVLVDGVEKSDTLLTASTKSAVGTSKTVNAGSGLDAPMCPIAVPPPVCGDNVCQSPETAASCPTDCTVKPACYSCDHATYDVYIINPDLSERHTGTAWVVVQDRGNGIKRYSFEDATLNPSDPNYDHNDAVVDVDSSDCSKLKFTFISSDAGWDHQVRFKVLIDGVQRSDALLTSSTKSAVGATKTVDAGAGLDAPMCPVTASPVCGDGACTAGENTANCPADCPAPTTAVCGNAVCETGENNTNCPADCPIVPVPPIVTPPTTSADHVNPANILFFAEGRALPLHRDNEGFYRVLPTTPISITIPVSALPHPVESITLNFIDGSYLFSENHPGVTGSQEWVDVSVPARTGIASGSITFKYLDGTTETIPFEVRIVPFGTVYYLEAGQRVPIEGATVVLTKSMNPSIQWDAKPYGQSNPDATDSNGRYGFMVPPGRYVLDVYKEGYRPVETQAFDVSSEVVAMDIEMIPIPKTLADLIIPGQTLTQNIGNVARGLGDQTGYVVKIFQKEFIQDPRVKSATTQYVLPATAIVMTAILATALQASTLVSYLYFLISQPILLLGRRKRKEYGTVYDALTKRPIDLAIVRLIRTTTGKLVRTLVTDKQGRYAFLVDPGEYRIEASKQGYTFPTLYLKDRKEDSQFLDLYHGEVIRVGEKGAIITANIPMDPLESIKTAKRLVWEDIGRKLQNVMAFSSVIITFIAALAYGQAYLWALLVLQIALYFLFRRLARPSRPKNWGIIYDEKTKKPIPFAVARIVETAYSKVLESRVTDSKGRYNFLVGNNKYVVTVEKPGYESHKTDEIDLTDAGKEGGVISKDIALKQSEKK